MQGVSVKQCTNPLVREYNTEAVMANTRIMPFHYDYNRYDLGDSRFKGVGPIGEKIVKRIFASSQLVRMLYIQPNRLTVVLSKEKFNTDSWLEVEPIVLEILDSILFRTYQSY